MITIESTPEFVASVYERMDRTLSAVRQRLARPMGLAEKVLLAHLDDPSNTDIERGKSLRATPARSGHSPGRSGPDCHAPVMAARRTQTAVTTSIHCDPPDPGAGRGRVDLRSHWQRNRECMTFCAPLPPSTE